MGATHAARDRPAPTGRSRPGRAPRTGWPVVWLFAGYPLWWALGLGQFAFWVFAVPMAAHLVRRYRTDGVRLPPGFVLWALFLVWSVAGLALVGLVPAHTVPDSGGLLGALIRVASYLAVTVLLLYVGNTRADELPDRVLARALGWLCLATFAGGLLGMAAPTFEFTSPVELVLPDALASDPYVRTLVHPAAAQVMDVLGYENARPKAPWEYTNTWGNMLSLLVVWLLVGWVARGSWWRRWAAGAAVVLAAAPIVYSLNRALWVGLALSVVFVLVQLARRGRIVAVTACAFAAATAAVVVALSPLMPVIQERMANPHSDGGRAATSVAALRAANDSPVMGWGTTRDMLGSSESIAIGPSPECPGCGNHTIGNNGQFWLLLIANGWGGAALFLAFFAGVVWRHRRDVTLIGSAALLTILLLFWYMFFYVALTAPLAVSMVAVAVLWRRAAGADREPATAAGGVAR